MAKVYYFLFFVFGIQLLNAQQEAFSTVETEYKKQEYYITMRDGVKLFTAVYSPRDSSGSLYV